MFGNCSYCNAEIMKFYLTKWSTSVIPYFLNGGEITSFTGLTESWSEIILNTATARYGQNLNSTQQNGLTYEERMTLTFPHADSNKWADLTSVLRDRYIIVFKDANENWYCMGYRYGTKVLSYTLEENEYSIVFQSPLGTNLLTALNSTYAIANII